MSDITAAVLPDGRIQAWRIKAINLETRWKQTTDPNSRWTNWGPFVPALPAGAVLPLKDVTAGTLSDGRLQLWVIDNANVLFSTWKQTTDPNSLWVGWINFIPTPQPLFVPVDAAAAPLPDKRLQLFIIDPANNTWTAWKTTTASNSPWTPFTAF